MKNVATQWAYSPTHNNINTINEEEMSYNPGPFLVDSNKFRWTSLTNYVVAMPPFVSGYSPYAPNNYYVIDMICEGQVNAEYKLNGNPWVKLDGGMNRVGVYSPQEELCWRWNPVSNSDEPLLISCVYLPTYYVAKIAVETLDIEPSKVRLSSVVNASDAYLREQLTSMKDELENGNPFGPIYADIAAQGIAIHLLKHYCNIEVSNKLADSNVKRSREKINMAIDYINCNLCNEITLQQLASLIGVSEYHFLRIFRDEIGQSPLQYIISKRIERAKMLMQRTELSTTEVALDVGYSNISHFINVFKRVVGKTPAKYQKAIRA